MNAAVLQVLYRSIITDWVGFRMLVKIIWDKFKYIFKFDYQFTHEDQSANSHRFNDVESVQNISMGVLPVYYYNPLFSLDTSL